MSLKLEIPYDEFAEIRVLGAICTSYEHANIVFPELNETDFFLPAHRTIFVEARTAYVRNEALDFYWLLNSLTKSDKLKEIGGIEYLNKVCFLYGQGGIDCESYCKDLRNLSQLRQLITLSQSIGHDCCQKGANSEEVISQVQTNIYKLQRIDSKALQKCSAILDNVSEQGNFRETVEWMVSKALAGEKPFLGIPSGYPILDDVLGYFRNGAIYYIGARTSMGKTTFLLNLIDKILAQNIPIGMFSLEMPSAQIVLKLACIKAGVRFSQFEEGKLSHHQMARLYEAADSLHGVPFYLDSQTGITINQLRARAKRMQIAFGVKFICIDYLTLIKSNANYNNKHMSVDEVSKGLQSLAKELNIPILCLAQLNRLVTSRKDFTPTLSDFRESGSIEEDADACILIHRPDYYEPTEKPGQIQIIVAKNRIRGILKKIEFVKDENSEIYQEAKSLADSVKTVNLEFSGKSDWHSPYDDI